VLFSLAPLCNIKWRASTFCDFLHDGRAGVECAGAWYKQQHSTNSPFSENTCIPQLAYNNGFINISCRQLSRERKIKSKSISIYSKIYTFTNISLLQQHFSLVPLCSCLFKEKEEKHKRASLHSRHSEANAFLLSQQQQQPLFALARIGSKHFSAQSQVELKMLNFN
jgi:hypothetical protein